MQKSVTYARDGIRVLGIVENMSEVSVSSCGAENELFEEIPRPCARYWTCRSSVVFPSIVRSPRHSTKGNRCQSRLSTIQKYQDIVGRIQALLVIKKSWRRSCLHRPGGDLMKFVCLNCETYMTFQKVEKPVRSHSVFLRLSILRSQVFDGDEPR